MGLGNVGRHHAGESENGTGERHPAHLVCVQMPVHDRTMHERVRHRGFNN